MSHSFAETPVLALADSVRRGSVNAETLLDAFVDAAGAANGTTNAVVHWQVAAARREAREASHEGLLAGVPFTVKEALPLRGAPHTSGSVYRRGVVATEDMACVRYLRRAGAIPFASTNMSEMGAQWESVNPIYGRSHNPHDPSRTPGGSSGGCGALVASGGTGFSVGADTGGSIRIPAAFCGVFGHKGTPGAVDIEGHVPPLHGNLSSYCAIGPLTRHARDLWPLFQIMSGREPHEMRDRDALDAARGCQVWLSMGLGRPAKRATGECRDAVRRAGQHLARLGAHVEELDPSALGNPFMFWTSIAKVDGSADFANEVTDGEPHRLALFSQLAAHALGDSDHTTWSLSTLLAERFGVPLLRPFFARYVDEAAKTKRRLVERLGPRGVLVMPVHPRTAFRHGGTQQRPTDFAYAGLANALGLPATAVPMGRGEGGLPLSVQVVGAPGMDSLTTAIAEALAEPGGGWVRPGRLRA